MNYSESLAWLYSTQWHGIKLGLENIARLCEALGVDLKRPPRFLHVAGTNGKGSVCAMLDSILREAKIRVGLFTSPHLVSFRERIRLDGEMISVNETREGLEKIRALLANERFAPTFFEITTALALDYFQKQRVEIVVLETGMGGRLDATNIVTPLASVITAIDIDHAQWLGDTLEKIAREKAGIIKHGAPVISAPQRDEAARVLREVAAEKNAPLKFVTEPLENFEIALAGSHQKLNAAIAVETLRAAKIEISDEAIRAGLREVEWPGRFQQIQRRKAKGETLIVLDGAHNPAAAARLAQTWRENFATEKAALIFSAMRDKEVRAVLRELLPIAREIIVTPVQTPRSLSADELHPIACELAPDLPCTRARDFTEALKIATRSPCPILVAGSLFLVGEALAVLQPNAGKHEKSLQ